MRNLSVWQTGLTPVRPVWQTGLTPVRDSFGDLLPRLFYPQRFVAHVAERQPRVDGDHGIDVTRAWRHGAVDVARRGNRRGRERSECGIARCAAQDHIAG